MKTIALHEKFNYTFIVPVDNYVSYAATLARFNFSFSYTDLKNKHAEYSPNTPKVLFTISEVDINSAAFIHQLLLNIK